MSEALLGTVLMLEQSQSNRLTKYLTWKKNCLAVPLSCSIMLGLQSHSLMVVIDDAQIQVSKSRVLPQSLKSEYWVAIPLMLLQSCTPEVNVK